MTLQISFCLLVHRHIGVRRDRADENGLFFGRQGQVFILVERLDQTTDQLVRRTDGHRQTTRWNLINVITDNVIIQFIWFWSLYCSFNVNTDYVIM